MIVDECCGMTWDSEVIASNCLGNAGPGPVRPPAEQALRFLSPGGALALAVNTAQLPAMTEAVLRDVEHATAFRARVRRSLGAILSAERPSAGCGESLTTGRSDPTRPRSRHIHRKEFVAMRITSIGHAGLLLETAAGRIVCDPWFTPAYFGSWVPFPDNTGIDPELLANADYLYVSHLHRDHFDPDWLKRHMSKKTTVLLPGYPVPDLYDAMKDLGFRNFIHTRDNQVTDLDGGLRIMINALTSPTDGPIGDSGLLVDDGSVRIFNQNDARPVESGPVEDFGPLHGHFLQFSGAIWYPMVYDFPDRMKATVGRRKRQNGMERALKYIGQYKAAHVFPFAGPPCFLDEDLFHLNDLDRDETNVFPDQFSFLEFLHEQNQDNAHLFLTGTTVELTPDSECVVEQIPHDEIISIQDRRTYLISYGQKVKPVVDGILAALPQDRSDLLGQLKEWVQPLIESADHMCAGVNGRVLLEVAAADEGHDERIVFDFLSRQVVAESGQECRYRFRAVRPLIEELVRSREQDWVNQLFLSCRFDASRTGPYNEYVYTFFKSLSVERMAYVEGYYAASRGVQDYARAGDHVVQRYCPHLNADLVRFGTVRDGVLTCQLHGWEFELASGHCLTSDDRQLETRPLRHGDEADSAYPRIATADADGGSDSPPE
ncbi:Rieske 2Fe-2S domain-containing protein [Streptomyces cacaoi]